MRVALIGQQAFGKSALEAFLARGTTVAGVFCAPERPGAKADPLRESAQQHGVQVFQLPSLKGEDATRALRGLEVDLAVMAYVLQFAPQAFVNVPEARHHPVSPLAPAALPRAELGQLADHPWRDAHRADDLPSLGRARRGSGDSAEDGRDRPRRHARQRLLQPSVSARRGGAAGGRRSGRRAASTARRCRTRRSPPTRAGAAIRRRASTGTPTSTRCTT